MRLLLKERMKESKRLEKNISVGQLLIICFVLTLANILFEIFFLQSLELRQLLGHHLKPSHFHLGVYNRVKESNPLVGNALATAESTVQQAAAHATTYPSVQRLSNPLAKVDETLARGLTCLEQRVPIVKAEPAVVS